MKKEPKTPKRKLNPKDSNLWEYLRAKLYVRGLKDNNLTARQIFDYIVKKYK